MLFTTLVKECCMFPEYRDLISHLKNDDARFAHLFNKHNELDRQIQNMEDGVEFATQTEIEILKKKKLLLKDEMYAILKKVSAEEIS